MVDEQTLNRMRPIKERAEDELLNRPGITGVDIGRKVVDGQKTDELAIRVYVEEKSDVPAEQRIPARIEGVQTDVIEAVFELQPLVGPVESFGPRADTGYHSTLVRGISVGTWGSYTGTLGMIVTSNAFGEVGRPMLLSNAHVLADGVQPGAIVTQPGPMDGGTTGTHTVGKLARSARGGLVDCAVALLDTTKRGYSCYPISGELSSVRLDTECRKQGRTTGLTFGTVDTTDLTTEIDGFRFHHQIGIEVDSDRSEYWSHGGDSGSAVTDLFHNVFGLHHAGRRYKWEDPNKPSKYGIACSIYSVTTALNVRVCKTKPKETGEKSPKEQLKEPEKNPKELAKGIENPVDRKIFVESRLLESTELSESSAAQHPSGGPLEERLSRLEERVDELTHFIGPESRPDLSSSALRGEADLEIEQAEDAEEPPEH